MIDLEYQKKRFENHVATFYDFGNIKVLDFEKPGCSDYRIRFTFEDDHYRLHISGDLGELIAYNFTNMVWKDFYSDFVHNPYYFEEKIQTHNRPIYSYEVDKAKKDLKELFEECDYEPDGVFYESIDELIDDILEDFDYERGISQEGYNKLDREICDAWEVASSIGKERTGIIELYLLAFELAYKQLEVRDVH